MPVLTHPYTKVMARATFSGTANVFLTVTGASIASGSFVAGRKYLLLIRALLDSPASGNDFEFATFHGNTLFPDSSWADEPEGGTTPKMQYSWFTVWTAVSGEAINLRLLPRDAAVVYGVQHIKMLAVDLTELIEGTDWYYNEVAANTVLDAADSATNNATVGFTPAVAGQDYLVLSSARMQEVSISLSYISKLVSTGTYASAVPSARREGEDAVSFGKVLWTMGRVYKALGAVAQTFTEKSSLNAAGTTEARTHSKVFALNLDRLQKQASAYTEAGTDLSATAFATQLQSVTLTPDIAGDVLVLSYWTFDPDDLRIGGKERLQVDNADVPGTTETADSFNQNESHDSNDFWAFFNFDVYNSNTSAHTYDLDASTEAALAGRVGEFRTLVAVTLQTGGILGNVVLALSASGTAVVAVKAAGAVVMGLKTTGGITHPVQAAGAVVMGLKTTGNLKIGTGISGEVNLPLTVAGTMTVQVLGAGVGALSLVVGGTVGVRVKADGGAGLILLGAGSAVLGPLIFPLPVVRYPRRVLRLEVWSDLRHAAGVMLGVFRWWHRGLISHAELNAVDDWAVTVPGVPWFVTEDYVLSPVFSDGSYLERRIMSVVRGVTVDGDTHTSIKAVHPLVDFTLRTQVRATDAAGRVRHKFTRQGITGREHLEEYIVGEMRRGGMTWWNTGFVERDTRVRLSYNSSTPAKSLVDLRERLELEVRIRDDGVSQYLVDLVAAERAAVPPIPVRYARNTGGATVERRIQDQATVIYVTGTISHDQPGTPGNMRWRIRAVEHPDLEVYRVYLEDNAGLGFGPLRFPGQLVGKRLTWRGAGRVLRQIEIVADNPTAQSVDLNFTEADPVWAELMTGKLVGLRAGDGTELTYVSIPDARPLAGSIERTDIPGTNNQLLGSSFRHWVTDAVGVPIHPVHWYPTSEDGVTLSQNLFETYWETGGASVLMETRREHEGIVSDIVPLDEGTLTVPVNTVDTRTWFENGQAYLMLELFNDDSDEPLLVVGRDAEEPGAVVNDATPKDWWTDLAMPANVAQAVARWNKAHPETPLVNDFTRARVSLRQRGAVRVRAYVDRLQLTETEDIEPYAEGSGAAQLWNAAQIELSNYGGPAETVAVDYRDVAPLGHGVLPPDAVAPGVTFAIRLDSLGVTRNARVASADTLWDEGPAVGVNLEGRPQELTRRLARAN